MIIGLSLSLLDSGLAVLPRSAGAAPPPWPISDTSYSHQTARLTRAGHTTLFVPTDEAIMALPHKPHNNPSGGTSDEDAQKNVEAFLSAHIVPADIEVGKEAETLGGTKVTLQKDGDGMRVVPGDAKVVGSKTASNGMIYYLGGIVEY